MRPHKNLLIHTTCYHYDGSRGGESANYVGVPATPAAMPEPSGDKQEEEESLHTDASGPMTALNDVKLPHGLTHTPATFDCIDCNNAKRRDARHLNGVATTDAKTDCDINTMGHSRITEGFGPAAIGGSQWVLGVKGRAIQFGCVGPAKDTPGDAVVYHDLVAVG